MSYYQQDAHNLATCKALFGTNIKVVGDANKSLFHVPLTQFIYDPNAATILAKGLISAARYNREAYSWIDVQSYYLPEILASSLKQCAGFDLRLVVTHDEKCSHGPGKRFPLPVMKLLSAASSSDDTWHPVLEKMVPSMKNWVKTVQDLPENHPVFVDPRSVTGYYHAVAEVLRLQGACLTVDRLLVHMGGAEIARIAADQDDLLIFVRNGIL